MSARGALIAVVAALIATGAPSAAASVVYPTSACDDTSWVAGTVAYCHGVLVYRDYVYDDYGADLGLTYPAVSSTASLDPSAGDQRYPNGDVNSADLVWLKLWLTGGRLHVHAQLNALWHPNSTTLAVAVGPAGGAAGRGGRWGGLDVSSSGWEEIAFFTHGDTQTNTIDGTMPAPRWPRWRVQAVTAQSATGTVMNVAFRGPDEQAGYRIVPSATSPYPYSGQGAWFEDNQAHALGTGDISQFGFIASTPMMRHHASWAQPVGPGLHERVYTSRYTVGPGKGMSYTGLTTAGNGGSVPGLLPQLFHFFGRWQPYGIYLPDQPGPHGLQFVFHGNNTSMSSLINQPGMQQDFGQQLNRILVVPLERGPNGWGSEAAERDILDVLNDVESNYDIDHTRVFSGGYSVGGYVALRMAEFYPQLFAGVIDWVGVAGDDANGTPVQGTVHVSGGAEGDVTDFVANLLDIPTVMLYSAGDEFVQLPSTSHLQQAFALTSDPYIWYLHTGEHFTLAFLDDWRKEAADSANLTLDGDPSHVIYRTDTRLDDWAYGIRHDAAYWVSAIRARQPGVANVDLTNQACGGSVPEYITGQMTGLEPVPWTADYRRTVGAQPFAPQPKLSGALTNVASLTIDTRQTCLDHRAVLVTIDTDGPTTIRFTDGRRLALPGSGAHAILVPAGEPNHPRRCRTHRKRRLA